MSAVIFFKAVTRQRGRLMKLSRLLALIVGTFLAFITILAAQDRGASSPPGGNTIQDEKSQAPVIRCAANLVLVDVVVTHDGHPVKGLEQQAFHIFEDGKEQAIKAFEEHGPGTGEPQIQAPALPPNTYTN